MTQRVVLVTGGTGGIGTAICQSMANSGHCVIANTLDLVEDGLPWQTAQKKQGYEFEIIEGDVTDFEDCKKMVDGVIEKMGRIDILINNAGITRDSFFKKMTKEQWDDVVDTNMSSLFNVTRHVTPTMVDNRWGRIINISSVNGIKGQAGQTNYSASKAGCIGFTKALALELVREGVTVNAIAPGYVSTPMVMAIREDIRDKIVDSIPMKRLAEPQEIAGLAVYLSSDLAGYITGTTVNINGGMHM